MATTSSTLWNAVVLRIGGILSPMCVAVRVPTARAHFEHFHADNRLTVCPLCSHSRLCGAMFQIPEHNIPSPIGRYEGLHIGRDAEAAHFFGMTQEGHLR